MRIADRLRAYEQQSIASIKQILERHQDDIEMQEEGCSSEEKVTAVLAIVLRLYEGLHDALGYDMMRRDVSSLTDDEARALRKRLDLAIEFVNVAYNSVLNTFSEQYQEEGAPLQHPIVTEFSWVFNQYFENLTAFRRSVSQRIKSGANLYVRRAANINYSYQPNFQKDEGSHRWGFALGVFIPIEYSPVFIYGDSSFLGGYILGQLAQMGLRIGVNVFAHMGGRCGRCCCNEDGARAIGATGTAGAYLVVSSSGGSAVASPPAPTPAPTPSPPPHDGGGGSHFVIQGKYLTPIKYTLFILYALIFIPTILKNLWSAFCDITGLFGGNTAKRRHAFARLGFSSVLAIGFGLFGLLVPLGGPNTAIALAILGITIGEWCYKKWRHRGNKAIHDGETNPEKHKLSSSEIERLIQAQPDDTLKKVLAMSSELTRIMRAEKKHTLDTQSRARTASTRLWGLFRAPNPRHQQAVAAKLALKAGQLQVAEDYLQQLQAVRQGVDGVERTSTVLPSAPPRI